MALARAPARSPRSAGEAMTPNLALMIETIERALAVAILPAAGNASAREEASLAILFTRWIRDVVDHVADAERASYHDCRATLTAVCEGLLAAAPAEEALPVLGNAQAQSQPETAAEIRNEVRKIKKLLGDLLGSLRAAGGRPPLRLRGRVCDTTLGHRYAREGRDGVDHLRDRDLQGRGRHHHRRLESERRC